VTVFAPAKRVMLVIPVRCLPEHFRLPQSLGVLSDFLGVALINRHSLGQWDYLMGKVFSLDKSIRLITVQAEVMVDTGADQWASFVLLTHTPPFQVG
jgi:hypothetical protein